MCQYIRRIAFAICNITHTTDCKGYASNILSHSYIPLRRGVYRPVNIKTGSIHDYIAAPL